MDIQNNIGFGCIGLSAQSSQRKALKLLETAFDQGIRHYDTAPLYGQGYSEKILSKFLREHRNQVTVTTKFGLSNNNEKDIPVWLALPLNHLKKKLKENKKNVTEFSDPGLLAYRKIDLPLVRDNFEKSIRRLNTDYIDYYLLHEGLPNFLTDEALSYIVGLKQKGDVKKIGIAAAYTNLISIEPKIISNWDILQYENSILHSSDDLVHNFSDKKHIYHSVLKPLAYKKFKDNFKNEISGIMLARSIKNNPSGLMLFSSSKINNIRTNLATVNAYSNYSVAELNKILVDAIY